MKEIMVDVVRWSLIAAVGMVFGCGSVTDGGGGSGDFVTLYDSYFYQCDSCHGPDAPGKTSDTEQSLDFTDVDTAYASITGGVATGLTGNQAGCNGVPFLGDAPETSLLVAVVDESVRATFSLADYPDCDGDAITDMTLRVGNAPDATTLDLLYQWVDDQTSGVARVSVR